MARKKDWAGKVQGKLTVVSDVGRDERGHVLWQCECSCGASVIKTSKDLKSGTKTCSAACGVGDSNRSRATHGMWRSKEYACWAAMKQRCLNPKNKRYATYGGRGIMVHQEWINSFDSFFRDVGPAPSVPRASLDRIDPDGNYEPRNVRWATPRDQSNNLRSNVKVEFRGESLTLAEVARAAGIPYHQVFQRYHRGLTGEDLVVRHKVGRKATK